MKCLSVKKLYDDLDEWIYINIDSDIYECKSQRPEYQHYVKEAEDIGLSEREISKYTLNRLESELELPFYKQRTFWVLLKLLAKKYFFWL